MQKQLKEAVKNGTIPMDIRKDHIAQDLIIHWRQSLLFIEMSISDNSYILDKILKNWPFGSPSENDYSEKLTYFEMLLMGKHGYSLSGVDDVTKAAKDHPDYLRLIIVKWGTEHQHRLFQRKHFLNLTILKF